MYDFSGSLYSALNVSAITDLLADYNGVPALFAEYIIPPDCTEFPTVNFYQSGIVDGRQNYGSATFTIACRSLERKEAEAVGNMVFDTLNRSGANNYFLSCVKQACIPPADPTDVFNQPIQVTILMRS